MSSTSMCIHQQPKLPNSKTKSNTPSYDVFDVRSFLDAHRHIWWQAVTKEIIRVRNGAVDSPTYQDGRDNDIDILEGLLTVEGVIEQIQDGSSKMIAGDQITYKISNVEVVGGTITISG
eukprot:scaffold8372_cov76-Cyclotella_meneghiniana.AAC.7